MTKEAQEHLAYVMTLESQARVGSYQHAVSSGPWLILAAERAELVRLSTNTRNPVRYQDQAVASSIASSI